MFSPMRDLLRARLSPFRHSDFSLFFLAQTLSLIGQWSHDLARAWIIIAATGSSGELGNLNLAIAIPCLLLILRGGVLVDRTDVRRLIIWTKSLMGLGCLVLASLTAFSKIEIWHLLVFGLFEGVIVAFDSPAFQALTVRLVPREDFQQAIALNSTNFHASRMLGPLVAAWLMAVSGPGLVFLFDGITYFGVALVLTQVTLLKLPPPHKMVVAGRQGLRDGLKYIWGHPNLRYRVLQLMLTITCVYPLMVAVFRVYVQNKFHLDQKAFGTVFSFPAMGSMTGALAFAIIKPTNPMRALWLGVPLAAIMLLVLPSLEALPFTVAAMTLTGFALYLTFASLTVSMQLDVDEAYRGRLSAVIGMGFSAIGPLMCFPWGHLADLVGAPFTIYLCAALFTVGSAGLAIQHSRQG
jgi:MFS family permease